MKPAAHMLSDTNGTKNKHIAMQGKRLQKFTTRKLSNVE